ncbi:MAG: UDP-3-O-acyl-N-acetylglucosamine deacetylase, partial [Cyanobacteriota bacterium]
MRQETTVGAAFSLSGVGLHSGETTTVHICPAKAGEGRYFVRVDLPGEPKIPASVVSVSPTMLSTELRQGEASIRTVEHLLASLAGFGVDNARIEVNGPEVPLLDGSGQVWAEAIASVGIVELSGEIPAAIPVSEAIWVREGDAFVAALPSPEMRFTYGI